VVDPRVLPATIDHRLQMTDALRVEWRDEEAARSVWVFGEIDLATVDELRKGLDCDKPRLNVDLSNVTFMDLTGLRCLIEAAEGREAVALVTSPRVDRLIDLTETGHLFEIQ
jgi:anti-anti-sigma factor